MLADLIFGITNRLLDFEEVLCSLIGCKTPALHGVTLGRDVKLVGRPSINMVEGSLIQIGNNAVLRSRSRHNAIGINHSIILRTQQPGAKIVIGSNTGISGGAICARELVMIGDNCLIGSNVVITDNDFHPVKPENRRHNHDPADIPAKPVTIHSNVWIGADSYILKGVTIGSNSVIGAMSVVTMDVPENCVAAGNPAKIIRKIE